MSYAPDDYALVIGIDHYPKWANGTRSLKGAVSDAKDFHEWLISPTGGGLQPRNARLVLSTQDPVAPLQNIIDEEFRTIRALSKDRTRRRFYFYFSGHGHSPAMSEAQALCLANWSLEDQGAALHLDSYRKASAGCLNFEESLFFVDCCRVREVTPLGKASDLECGAPQLSGKHYIVFYATEHYESGYESDAENARGYFTEALVRILRAGTIEAQELGMRLGEEVVELAKPRKQVARHLSYAGRKIFLGPPTLPAQPAAPAPEPTAPTRTAQLDVSLATNLRTDSGPGEHTPAPPPGEITVSRGDRIIDSGRGGLRAVLPLGRYAIRVRHGEASATHEIELNGDLSLPLELPRRRSAAPLSSTVEKLEIITDPMVAASKQRPFDGAQAIFIALRHRHAPFKGQIPGSLTIHSSTKQAEFAVVKALTVTRAEPGVYELQYSDPDGTTQSLSVPVAAGWDTQIFLVEDRGRLAIERASVFMQAAGHGFNPADALIDAYELALADLVSGGPGPDRSTLEDLLHGKFRNPLFGLVGAHFLVRELRAAERFSAHRHDLLRIVIQNLAKLLGEGNPDVLALRFLWAQLQGEPGLFLTREASEAPPPLLQVGLQALVEATVHHPASFAQLDDVATGLRPSSAWACWRKQEKDVEVVRSGSHRSGRMRDYIRMSPRPRLGALERIYIDAGYRVSRTVLGTDHELEARERKTSRRLAYDEVFRLATMPDWVVAVMRDEIEQGKRTRQPLDYGKLVPRLRLPRGLLEQAERIVRAEVATAATPTETATRAMARGA